MTTLFISDLHLDASRPHITQLFVDFVRTEATRASALYVLGDLFEAWVGDDCDDDTASQVAGALSDLHAAGVPCFYVHGNRDFLLGKRFMKAAGAIWLPDPFVITAFGTRITLAHGDALCTADRAYLRFRRFARCRFAQMLFLAWPFRWRQALAERMRSDRKSTRLNSSHERRSRMPSSA